MRRKGTIFGTVSYMIFASLVGLLGLPYLMHRLRQWSPIANTDMTMRMLVNSSRI